MKLARLWQPRKALFWYMLMFNALSSLCTWAMRALPLNTAGLLLVGTVALLNVGFGLLAAWALVRDSPLARHDGPDQRKGVSSSASTASTSE